MFTSDMPLYSSKCGKNMLKVNRRGKHLLAFCHSGPPSSSITHGTIQVCSAHVAGSLQNPGLRVRARESAKMSPLIIHAHRHSPFKKAICEPSKLASYCSSYFRFLYHVYRGWLRLHFLSQSEAVFRRGKRTFF